MFVTVKYGDNRSHLFNANCKNHILLHQIRKRCDCAADDAIDVSDEKGSVKNLRNNLEDYGTQFLQKRENLILLKVECSKTDDNQEKTRFTPLLNGLKGNKEFTDALNPIPEDSRGSPTPSISHKPARRRSSVVDFNLEDLKNGKQKARANGSANNRKSMARRATTRTLIKSKN